MGILFFRHCERLSHVIAQAHDYRLGHGLASLTAPLVLYVIPLRVLTAAVLLCKYKYLRNRTLHVIASLAKQSKNPDSRMSQDFFIVIYVIQMILHFYK